jgi:hypothetical protein
VLEWQRYHLVTFTGVSSGSASNGDGSLSESIVEALNKIGDSKDCNNNGYDSDAAMKEFEVELAQEELEKKQSATKQVFMACKGDDGDQTTKDPPAPAAKYTQCAGARDIPPPTANETNDDLPVIHGRPSLAQPIIPKDRPAIDFITSADKVMYGTWADPFTPEYFEDISNLEKKRRDMLKEAKYIKDLGEKLNQDITKAQNTFKHARDMEEKYYNLLQTNDGGDLQLI